MTSAISTASSAYSRNLARSYKLCVESANLGHAINRLFRQADVTPARHRRLLRVSDKAFRRHLRRNLTLLTFGDPDDQAQLR